MSASWQCAVDMSPSGRHWSAEWPGTDKIAEIHVPNDSARCRWAQCVLSLGTGILMILSVPIGVAVGIGLYAAPNAQSPSSTRGLLLSRVAHVPRDGGLMPSRALQPCDALQAVEASLGSVTQHTRSCCTVGSRLLHAHGLVIPVKISAITRMFKRASNRS